MFEEYFETPKDYWVVLNIDFKFTACNKNDLEKQIENFKNHLKKYSEGVNIDDITIEEN